MDTHLIFCQGGYSVPFFIHGNHFIFFGNKRLEYYGHSFSCVPAEFGGAFVISCRTRGGLHVWLQLHRQGHQGLAKTDKKYISILVAPQL